MQPHSKSNGAGDLFSRVNLWQPGLMVFLVMLLFTELARVPSRHGVYQAVNVKHQITEDQNRQGRLSLHVQKTEKISTSGPYALESRQQLPMSTMVQTRLSSSNKRTVSTSVVSGTTAELTTAMVSVERKANESCPITVITGDWSRNGQRLGNTLCMLSLALMTAEGLGGGVRVLEPGNRYYNSTEICTTPTSSASPAVVANPKHDLFHCYTPCKCSRDSFATFRRVLQKFVLPNFFVRPRTDLEVDALVIHLRSGDVLRETRGTKYWQPPLTYYKYIIENFHNESPIYICTEVHEKGDGITGGNPVAEELLAWRPSQIKLNKFNGKPDLESDVATLLGTKFLVQAISSFSVTLASMSTNLVRTYIPKTAKLQNDGQFSCDTATEMRTMPKEWNCGADRGWPQSHGRASVVQVALPGYVAGDLMNFTHVKDNMLTYSKPLCHKVFPEDKIDN